MKRAAVVLGVSALPAGWASPAARGVSCSPPPADLVEAVITGSTQFGPLTDPWSLVHVLSVTPSEDGVLVEASVDVTFRAASDVPARVSIVARRDSQGSTTPMEDADNQRWLLPLRKVDGQVTIDICSGAARVDDAALDRLRSAGTPPESRVPLPSPDVDEPDDGSGKTLVGLAAGGLVIVGALTTVATIRKRRTHS